MARCTRALAGTTNAQAQTHTGAIAHAAQTHTRARCAFCGIVPARTQGVYADASVGGNLDSLTVSLGINLCGEIFGQKVKHCVQK